MLNKPAVTWRRLDRCDLCNNKVHRESLRMALMNDVRLKGENYLEYSDYNSTGWTSTLASSDSGTVSFGSRERCRTRVSDANVVTYINGAQTWDGADVFRAGPFDVSAWTSFVFSVQIGPHQESTDTAAIFSILYGDLSSSVAGMSVTGLSHRKLWFTKTIAEITTAGYDPADLYLFVSGDTTGEWWWEEAQLEKDVTIPGTFIATSGATVSQEQLGIKSMIKICPRCRYRYFQTFRGVIQREVQEPLDVDIPEIP